MKNIQLNTINRKSWTSSTGQTLPIGNATQIDSIVKHAQPPHKTLILKIAVINGMSANKERVSGANLAPLKALILKMSLW